MFIGQLVPSFLSLDEKVGLTVIRQFEKAIMS